jgi:hypothetical protein
MGRLRRSIERGRVGWGEGREGENGDNGGFPHSMCPSLCAKLQREGQSCGELRDCPAPSPLRRIPTPLRQRPAAAAPHCSRAQLHLQPAAAAPRCAQLGPRPAATPPRCRSAPLRPAGAAPSYISARLPLRPAAAAPPRVGPPPRIPPGVSSPTSQSSVTPTARSGVVSVACASISAGRALAVAAMSLRLSAVRGPVTRVGRESGESGELPTFGRKWEAVRPPHSGFLTF